MNFKNVVEVFEFDAGSVVVISVSVWTDKVDAVRVLRLDESDVHDFAFVVPDMYVAQLKAEGSWDKFVIAMKQLAGLLVVEPDTKWWV